MRSRTDLIHGLLLLAAMLVVFLPTLPYEFVYDDHQYVVQNARVRQGLTADNAQWAFRTLYFSNWHPLTWLSLMLDASLYGHVAWGYRLTNILLHIANTALVLLVSRKLTGRSGLAWWMAAVFALHPLHLESVVWISSRKDVLSILFGLCALFAYLRFAGKSSIGRYLAVAALLSLSLMAKQTLITFPFLLLLLDAWPLGRLRMAEPGWLRRLGWLAIEKLPLLAICIAAGLAAAHAQHQGGAISHGTDPAIRIINAVNSIATYLRQSAWPSGLCAFYPHPFDDVKADGWFFATAVMLAAVSALALWTLVRRNQASAYVAAGWFWFVGTLVPMLGLIQLGAAAHADRYMYFPLIGLSLLVGTFAARLADAGPFRWKRAIAMTGYFTIAALSGATFVQSIYWENNVTLFRRALAVAPDNMFTRTNLADGLLQQAHLLMEQDPHRARELLSEVPEHCLDGDRVYPLSAAYFNLTTSLRLLGNLPEAIAFGEQGVERFPEDAGLRFALAEARTSLGNALARQGQFDAALHEYRRALEVEPGNEQIIENIEIVEEMRRGQ